MKYLIDGKIYNTETSVLIARGHNGLPDGNHNMRNETIYKTKSGRYWKAYRNGDFSQGIAEGAESMSKNAVIEYIEYNDLFDEKFIAEFDLREA